MKKPRLPRLPSDKATPTRHEVTDADIDDAIAWAETAQAKAALHDLFGQQIRTLMEDAGLNEEEKQSVLMAMACPCCGSGTTSFTYKLRAKD